MLRIRLRMCQGVIAKSRTRTAGSCSICFSGVWADMRVHSRPPRNGLSPINFSTTVPLTRKVPKSTLIGIEHCPTYQGRRKLIETMGREGVYRLGTGS